MGDVTDMTIDDVLRDFAAVDYHLPRAAVQWSLDHWDEAAPRFVALLSGFADGSDRSRETEAALVFLLYLLGEHGEAAAFAPLCQLLHDQAAADAALGDDITTTLSHILISTFDGDAAPLRSVIEDAQADESVRDAAINAMIYLTRVSRIAVSETRDYLRHLLDAMQPRDTGLVWVGWTRCVSCLGFSELAPDVQGLFERQWVAPVFMSYRDFAADLQATLDDPTGMAGVVHERLGPFGSAIETLSGWYAFSEQRVRDEAARAERAATRARQKAELALQAAGAVHSDSTLRAEFATGDRNPLRHVGRNDPCPCGSGRKFKKCCLGKAELVPATTA